MGFQPRPQRRFRVDHPPPETDMRDLLRVRQRPEKPAADGENPARLGCAEGHRLGLVPSLFVEERSAMLHLPLPAASCIDGVEFVANHRHDLLVVEPERARPSAGADLLARPQYMQHAVQGNAQNKRHPPRGDEGWPGGHRHNPEVPDRS